MRSSPTAPIRSLAVLASIVLAACDGSTGPNANANLRLASPAVPGASVESASGLSIAGTNGTLLITDIKLIVDKFELERVESDACDDSSGSGACGEFKMQLFVADVPLGSGAVTVARDNIPNGTYAGLEFEVEDLFVDAGNGEDSLHAARINELLAQLRTTYADWPAGASMMIAGTFTPTGGAAQPFRVYFDAEVEVEHLFDTPLVIGDSTTNVTVELRPDVWFKNGDGTVRNLAAWSFDVIHELVEFEVELEHGFEVELDH